MLVKGLTHLSGGKHVDFISAIHCPYEGAMCLQVKMFLTCHLNLPLYDFVTFARSKAEIHVTFSQRPLCVGMKAFSFDGIFY